MSQILYLPEFIEQVSQIVFLAYFTVLGLFLPLYKEKFQKIPISASSVNKYHKLSSLLIWPFYSLLQLYEEKCHKSYISLSSLNKYHKSCF